MGQSDWELEGMLVLSPGERGLTARVLLLEDEFVIETADGERETWSRSLISANPYDTRTMQLGLGNATLFFEAAEPLTFAERLANYVETPRKRRRRQSKNTERSDPVTPTPQSQPAETSPDTAARKRTRFGRAEHEHSWETHAVGGGIVRSVCSSCGQITIDLTSDHEFTGDARALLTLRR